MTLSSSAISMSLSRWRTAITLALLGLAVLAVYFPIHTNPGDNTLQGGDYLQLHLFRIRFARETLFGPHPYLPGWYPRELLGTPFWSDAQNFPLIPTRLILLVLDPLSAFAVGVILSAELAALFAFLYARTLGLSRIAAAAMGWTFACTGFFAARVLCGHLPLLEAYPALPLLLWLVHRCVVADQYPGRARVLSNRLRALGGATFLICLAGHPQLPAYAIFAAAAYAVWMNHRRPGASAGHALRILATMALACGIAAFVLWPMALLIARSTRLLPLDPAGNDIAFPFERLAAFVLPWRDGWPAMLLRPTSPARKYANIAVFWETVCYVGLLPLAAMVFWTVRGLVNRSKPGRSGAFFICLGVGGLLLALPPMHDAFAHLPGVLLRSPARLIYFTLFALSFGFGAGVDFLLRLQRGKALAAVAVAAILVFQGIDLGRHDRCFIRTCQYWVDSPADRGVAQEVGDGRAAIDVILTIPTNREVDDIGSFDSIFLAKPYLALLDLGNLPPRYNSQYIDGSDLTLRALQVCGVRVLLTTKNLPGQKPTPPGQTMVHRKDIPNAADRVEFFPLDSTTVANLPTIHADLRNSKFDLQNRLLIPVGSPAPAAAAPPSLPPNLRYTRDDSDRMTIAATVPQSGYLRIDEAWDRGWHATVDGKPAPLFAGDDVFLTLPLSAGCHRVQLEFSTPGVMLGWIISAVCLSLMLWVARPSALRAAS